MKTTIENLAQWMTSRIVGPLAVTLAVLVLVVSEFGFYKLQDISAGRSASVETQIVAGRLRRSLLFMESAQRGYMLTARAEYLDPYKAQEQVFLQTIEQAQRLATPGDAQRDELLALVEMGRRKYSEMQEVLGRFDTGDNSGALELMMTGLGREMMSQFSAVTDEIIRQEAVYYRENDSTRQQVFLWTRVGIWVLVASCIAGALALMRVGREQESERRVHLLQLHAERDRLDEEVNRRTEETVELARHMERVREDERARLARELHDELGGLLTAVKLDVARIRKRIHDETGNKQMLIEHLTQSLDAGIALKRRIIEDLRPSSLTNLGLKPTLLTQCAEFAQRAELAVETEVEDLRLPPEQSLAIYRLVQEALTNIAKYAAARHVRVVLRRLGDQIEVRVEDDGLGFDPSIRAATGGHGLQGMRFRIRACDGDVMIRSAPGQGTTVRALLPA